MAGAVRTCVVLSALLVAVAGQFRQVNQPPQQNSRLKSITDRNPALHRLNDRVITNVFHNAGNKNEVVCTYCLFEVISSAFRMGNDLVKREIKDALGSPAPEELSEALLEVTKGRKTLTGLFRGYYAKRALACPRGADQKRCDAASSVLEVFGQEKDFTDPQTRRDINEDVSQATKGHIKNLFESLSADTELVFASALLFQDQWPSRLHATPFEFRVAGASRSTEVPTLATEEYLQVIDGTKDGVVGVALPYRDPAISLYCFTSASKDDDIRNLLYQQQYLDLAKSDVRNVLVRLPKFDVASKQYSYVETMELMGMREMFQGGLGPTDRLKVGQLVHKAIMETDEHGTTAAGAAGLAFVPLSARPTPLVVNFDHPFICSLVDNALVQPIFTAFVANPKIQ